jgi:DNA-binding NarL/FixJ family response regulator
MLNSGAKGYVLKNCAPEELINDIETVLKGRECYSNEVWLKKENHGYKNTADMLKKNRFTERETDVLKLLFVPHNLNEIAAILFIKKKTAEEHIRSMKEKCGAKSTAHLVRIAKAAHLLDE